MIFVKICKSVYTSSLKTDMKINQIFTSEQLKCIPLFVQLRIDTWLFNVDTRLIIIYNVSEKIEG